MNQRDHRLFNGEKRGLERKKEMRMIVEKGKTPMTVHNNNKHGSSNA